NGGGPKGENVCLCKHGKCDQKTGKCTCEPNWWGPQCSSSCYCSHNSQCDQQTGNCLCQPVWWGRGCNNQCSCNNSPCEQFTGRCQCRERTFGPRCDRYCQCYKGKCNRGWGQNWCETKCRNGTYGENCAFVCSDCVNGQCHFETGRCLCRPGSHGTYCEAPWGGDAGASELKPGQIARGMEANQRMGVIGAGALLALLLILLLSLLCCCCVCRKKDEARGSSQDPAAAKKPPRRLCGRFSRIGMKLPRIPLRRQKLPKVVVAHHDLENTLNCSFIEPPSVVEQPSPSWSSRGSFSSFDTTDEGPVYCVPHEESVGDSRDRGTPASPGDKLVSPAGGEEAGEYTFLKETGSVRAFPADSSETPLLKSSDSERSSCGSGSAGAALYARVARLSKQSKEEDDAVTESRSSGKPPSPERTKPRPPDPATKPKVSWI
ncbi:PREDICTED: scavenger receptor class F member 2, partial [Charadrius vociferus]|uniref:scavenger receptor class F member 2 n=1 Tax=Charadrius vociferus TaxID=50402 RepID=UPI0005212581